MTSSEFFLANRLLYRIWEVIVNKWNLVFNIFWVPFCPNMHDISLTYARRTQNHYLKMILTNWECTPVEKGSILPSLRSWSVYASCFWLSPQSSLSEKGSPRLITSIRLASLDDVGLQHNQHLPIILNIIGDIREQDFVNIFSNLSLAYV